MSSAKPPRKPAPRAPAAEGPMGWEQSEEVARRLLEDMAAAEAREAAARREARAEGHAVAEARRAGAAVSRAWEQEEEVYRRLASEMAALEKRGFPFTASRTNLDSLAALSMPPKLAPGATPPLPSLANVPRPAPLNRTPSVQAALDHPDWEQEEEVYHRLAAEIAELESRGVGSGQKAAAVKWVPKGPAKIVKSPSTEAALANPPWQQEQEVYERLVSELVTLETRADARIEATRRGAKDTHPPLDVDQKAYDNLQRQLREMETRDGAPASGSAMRRSNSRGTLLPFTENATGVHQRL